MHRVAHQNFCILNQTSFPYKNSLITEFSFKKDDDIIVCLEKLLLQDQISSIYLKSQQDLIKECNRLISLEIFSSTYQDNLSDSNNLAKCLGFWDNLLEQNQNTHQKEELFPKKYIKVCSKVSNHEILLNFLKDLIKCDRLFLEGYLRDEAKQNFLHSEEVKQACERNLKQIEIESLVNLHMNRLEELDQMYKDQFFKKQLQKKMEFHNLIEKLYKNCSDSIENNPTLLDNMSNKSGSSSEETTLGEMNIKQMVKERIVSEGYKKKGKKFDLNLCLGMQRKYIFKIKLRELESQDYFITKEEDLVKNLYKSLNEIRNGIFGIEQKALINIVSLKPEEGKILQESVKFASDLFFEGFEEQLQKTRQKIKEKKKKDKDNHQICFNNGDLLITKHGNLKTRFVFSVIYDSFTEFQNDFSLNWLRKVLVICNENQIKSISIPLDFFFNGSFTNQHSLKSYGDLLMKIIKTIKREINNFSLEYANNHFIKNIYIYTPKGFENSQNLFKRSKEILKNSFE